MGTDNGSNTSVTSCICSHLPRDNAARLARHPAVQFPRVEGRSVRVLPLRSHHLLEEARVCQVYLLLGTELALEHGSVLLVLLCLQT